MYYIYAGVIQAI